MSRLIAIAYPDEQRAAEVLGTLRREQADYLIDLDDAVYVTKNQEGKLKLHQSTDLTADGALWGLFWGTLVGLIFLVPFVGGVLGAAIGAVFGHYTDLGIDDRFVKDLSARLAPGSSAVFFLADAMQEDRVLPALSRYGGTVLRTSLSPEAESKLKAMLSQGKAAPVAA